MILFYYSTFVFSLSVFEAQKPKFLPKKVKQSFHTKSGPKFWNLKTMSNLYFLETKFFYDHFCLLRCFHPGPISWCFNGHKFELSGATSPLDLCLLLPHFHWTLQTIVPAISSSNPAKKSSSFLHFLSCMPYLETSISKFETIFLFLSSQALYW